MNTVISTARCEQAAEISELVRASFNEFVAPDWDASARKVFLEEASVHSVSEGITNGEYSAVACCGDRVVGFIHLPTPNLLSMLFVRADQLRRGIGKCLWNKAKEHLASRHPSLGSVELNASPYAVAAYSAMGFEALGEPFRKGGCTATRMAYFFGQERGEYGASGA